ncbi:hypothetical protein [Motilimonas sp. E26]|uniref:hypothetical protein n=1 Tax=Motilimonas sp. E26 TaxID=2865674 RepID=UPI001E4D63FA|nr:hypothetical protein [Motilimonas sp. E26]MCE0555995.1 hypothetical protein [Motilimonas sp. E26]
MIKLSPSGKQEGMATLLVTILLMLSATAFTFYTAKNKLFEIRASGNDYRYKEAYANAELGLDYAGTWLAFGKVKVGSKEQPAAMSFINKTSDEPLKLNIGSSTDKGTQKFIEFFASNQVEVVVKQSPTNPKLLQVVSTGRSRDGQAKAVVSREFYFSGNANNGGNNIPIAPITTNTQTLIEGSVQLASNPTAFDDQELSYWSSYSALQLAGNWFSYSNDGFADLSKFNNTLEAGDATLENELGWYSEDTLESFSELNSEQESFASDDISLSDPRFPDSLKEEYLGVDEADFAKLRNEVAKQAAEGEEGIIFVEPNDLGICDIPAGGQGEKVVWIYGDCPIHVNGIAGAGYSAGTLTEGVTVIIDGNADFRGGASINGLVYVVNSNMETQNSAAVNAKFGGSISVKGAMIVDGIYHGVVLTSGSIVVDYSADVLRTLSGVNASAVGGSRFGWVPGTWRDFNG